MLYKTFEVMLIMKSDMALKGLALEERELFRRIRGERDLEAQEELFFRYEKLLSYFAHRYASPHYPYAEVYQVAALGLLKAIRRFDPEKGTAFSTFAYPTIDGELKRFYRDHGEAVRLPRQLYELRNGIKSLDGEGAERMTPRELAERLDCTESELAEAMRASAGPLTLSLEQGTCGDGESYCLADTLGTECVDLAGAELRVILEDAMSGLDDRERRIIEEYFFRGLTQSAIAELLGTTQMQVSRVMRQALAKIRESLTSPVPALS
jgi:RNA polymerase sigma-B factor